MNFLKGTGFAAALAMTAAGAVTAQETINVAEPNWASGRAGHNTRLSTQHVW